MQRLATQPVLLPFKSAAAARALSAGAAGAVPVEAGSQSSAASKMLADVCMAELTEDAKLNFRPNGGACSLSIDPKRTARHAPVFCFLRSERLEWAQAIGNIGAARPAALILL